MIDAGFSQSARAGLVAHAVPAVGLDVRVDAFADRVGALRRPTAERSVSKTPPPLQEAGFLRYLTLCERTGAGLAQG